MVSSELLDGCYIYVNLLTCKGGRGVCKGCKKPQGVEEPVPRPLLGLEEWVMDGTSSRQVQYIWDLTVTRAEVRDGLEL